jgi:hypothetical protein
MKTRLVIIIVFAFFLLMPYSVDSAFASCIAEVDYEEVFLESELVFEGTVVFVDNSPGPQKIHFDVHEVSKGIISEERFILKNSEFANLGNDSYSTSSVNVGYTVGTTYNVYVTSGQTSLCTTKPTAPPSGYDLPEILPLIENKEPENSTDSYELDEPICLGGPGMELDENCVRIEKTDPYQDDEVMRMASEKVYEIEETMGGGSGTAVFDEYDLQSPIIIIGIILGAACFVGLMIFLRRNEN